MGFEGEHVIVTGAASGIGLATSAALAARGARVVGVDRDPDGLAAAVADIGGTAVVGSVSDPATWTSAIDAAGGAPRFAFLNAGIYGFAGPIDELPLERYEATIDANITGVVMGVRCCVPAMRANGGGSIVATASAAAIVAFEGNPIYTLTKQAVGGFVRAVAPSLAADAITLNAVCPGVVDTPMFVEAGGAATQSGAAVISPARVAATVIELLTSGETGICRAVREIGPDVDWVFPTWRDLARAGRGAGAG